MPAKTKQIPNFRDAAETVLIRYRSAVARLVEGLPVAVRTTAQLQEQLGASTGVAWSTLRVVRAPNPLEAGLYALSPGEVRVLAKSARGIGLAKHVVEEFENAGDELKSLIDEYAGDRQLFRFMLSDLLGEDIGGLELKNKREAFRVNTRLLGRQAKAHVHCSMFYPDSEGLVNELFLRGMTELKYFRNGSPVRFSYNRCSVVEEDPNVTETKHHRVAKRSIEGITGNFTDLGLLHQFCSDPLPDIAVEHNDERMFRLNVKPRSQGLLNACDFFFGGVIRSVPLQDILDDDQMIITLMPDLPVEVRFHDLLIHPSVLSRRTPRIDVFTGVSTDTNPLTYPDEDRLPSQEHAECLGQGLHALATNDVPGYTDMLRWACESRGWDMSEAIAYRFRIEYPILYSVPRLTLAKGSAER